MIKPSSLFLFTILLLVTVPLTGFALFTSTIALFVLCLRSSAVYLELGVSAVHNYLHPRWSPEASSTRPASPVQRPNSPVSARHSRRRRSSAASSMSEQGQQVAPRLGDTPPPVTRDYESVGGWRFPGSDGQNDEEAAVWRSMNSRLELPATTAERQRMHHRRSSTAGSISSSQFEAHGRGDVGKPGSGSGSSSRSRNHTPASSIRGIAPPSPDGFFNVNRLSSISQP